MCLAVASDQARSAREVLELEFVSRFIMVRSLQFQLKRMFHNCCRWRTSAKYSGVTGKFLNPRRNGIRPKAIAHGSSERNLTFVVLRSDLYKAMNALHDNLFLSQLKTLNIFLLVPAGWICLRTYPGTTRICPTSLRTQLKLIGLATARKWFFDEPGHRNFPMAELLTSMISNLIRKISRPLLKNLLCQFNCTRLYRRRTCCSPVYTLLNEQCFVITSSKNANTLSQDFYSEYALLHSMVYIPLQHQCRSRTAHY